MVKNSMVLLSLLLVGCSASKEPKIEYVFSLSKCFQLIKDNKKYLNKTTQTKLITYCSCVGYKNPELYSRCENK